MEYFGTLIQICIVFISEKLQNIIMRISLLQIKQKLKFSLKNSKNGQEITKKKDLFY